MKKVKMVLFGLAIAAGVAFGISQKNAVEGTVNLTKVNASNLELSGGVICTSGCGTCRGTEGEWCDAYRKYAK